MSRTTTTISASQRPLTFLSLDGGGHRGLALLYQLRHIMRRLPNVGPSDKLYPHKYFDLIGGTSTGGFIALMFGRLGMDVDSAIEKYQELGSVTFNSSDSFWKVVVSGAKFDVNSFEEVLKRWLNGQSLLDPNVDLRCRCFATTVPQALCTVADPILLRSYSSPPGSPPITPHGHEWQIWEAARATLASTYFPPLDLGGRHVFKDAGIFGIDNPALLILREAERIPAFSGRPVGCLVSLGTGLHVLTRPSASSVSNAPTSNDLLQRAYEKIRRIATTPEGAHRHLQELRNDLVAVATNTERTHREVAKQLRIRPRKFGNQPLYVRFNPFGGVGNINLVDFMHGAEIELLTHEYLAYPDVDGKVEDCAIILGELSSSLRPAPGAVHFRLLYRTGFEIDPFTCTESEVKQLYRDILPREPTVGYRSSVGNGAFTLEFERFSPVRWRSFLNAYLIGPVRVEATIDLARCTTIRTPSGAGVLVILPDQSDVYYDLFFLVEPANLLPVLHVLKLWHQADDEDEWTTLHCETLPHCSGQQMVRIEVTVLDDMITVSTNAVASAWTLSVPTSGGSQGLRAFGLCGIGPRRITWTEFQVSVAQSQDIPRDPPSPTPMPTPSPPGPTIHEIHPHTHLDLPAMRAIPRQPIVFAKLFPLEAVVAKLQAFINSLPSPSLNTLSAKDTYSLHVLPFLKSRFPPPSTNVLVPIPSNLLMDWKKATVDLFDVLLPEQLFPVVDLWRVALLDEKVLNWGTTEDGIDLIQRMFLKVISIKTNGDVPRSLLLTILRLMANCFSSDLLGQCISSSNSSSPDVPSLREAQTSLLVLALPHTDVWVRSAAATLAFNEAVLIEKPPMNNNPRRPSTRDEDWEVEMVCALVEALHREESEDVVYRITASLALFLHTSPFLGVLTPLLEVLQTKQKLREKLLEGRPGVMVVNANVRALIEEVADKLCT